MSELSFGHGRQSDAIDGGEREAQHASLKRLMKPTNRGSGVRVDVANGDPCWAEGHGKMFVLQPSGNQWCPHQTHMVGVPRQRPEEPKNG